MAKVDHAVVHRLLADRLKAIISAAPVIEIGQAREADELVVGLTGLTLEGHDLTIDDSEPAIVPFTAVIEAVADAPGDAPTPIDRLARLVGSLEAALLALRLKTTSAAGETDHEVLCDRCRTTLAPGATEHGASAAAQITVTGIARRFKLSTPSGGSGGGDGDDDVFPIA
jgi:hypothetical protein